MPFTVVLSPDVARVYSAFDASERAQIDRCLATAAHEAIQLSTSSRPRWMEVPGGSTGIHRVIVDDLWVLYELNDQDQTLTLRGAGCFPERAPDERLRELWTRPPSVEDDAWDNEGGSSPLGSG